ncbi:MAG: glycosyltransferase [Desulfovibrio sp.]|nr:glycosyltransferase [Desulfovibrio sp.]
MNILFLHPNFPGQFLQLARYLGGLGRHNVMYLSKESNGSQLPGVQVAMHKKPREATKGIHPYMKLAEEAVLEGQQVVMGIDALRRQTGFVPDVVMGHTGWGSTLYVKDILPQVPLIGYFEWFYNSSGGDVGYWPDEPVSADDKCRIRTTNLHHMLNLEACDVRYAPTEWQRSQFPAVYRDSMKVIHEGVETDYYKPREGVKFVLDNENVKLDLSDCEELVTYLSRGMEPYRGFPQFMDAIRILLKERPKCHVVLAGSDRACYGPQYSEEKTWKQVEIEKGGYDESRVHFVGHLSREEYLMLLQASDVHVYLSRPFILSWSCLEALGAACCLVASDTPGVTEAVEDNVNGLLVNFRRPEHIAMRIGEALDDPELRVRLGKRARESILERYDLKDCIKKQLNMIYGAMK